MTTEYEPHSLAAMANKWIAEDRREEFLRRMAERSDRVSKHSRVYEPQKMAESRARGRERGLYALRKKKEATATHGRSHH